MIFIIASALMLVVAPALILDFGHAPLWAWLAVGGSLALGNLMGWMMTRDRR